MPIKAVLTSKNSRKPLLKPILIIWAYITVYGNSTYVKIIPGSFWLQYDEILNLESRPPGDRYKIRTKLRTNKFSPVIMLLQGKTDKTKAIFHQQGQREKWRNRWLSLNVPSGRLIEVEILRCSSTLTRHQSCRQDLASSQPSIS